jgi:adenylate cyclase 1
MGVETRRVLAEGVWQVVFVVFLAYAMMPLKTWVAAVFGVFLPVVHVIVAAIFAKEFPSLTWQQVCVRHEKCQLIPIILISFLRFNS